MKKIVSLLLLLCGFFVAVAQGGTTGDEPVEMADAMRANGKIYVVVTVVVIILIGLFLYLFRLDRKISKLEKAPGQ